MRRRLDKEYNVIMVMLWVHIGIALTSLVVATMSWMSPAKGRINLASLLVVLTIATGTALVAMSPSHLIQACTTGLVYLAGVSAAIVLAQRKLPGNEQ
jgi:hypothetical protein